MPLFIGGGQDGLVRDLSAEVREYGTAHFFAIGENRTGMVFPQMREETYHKMRWKCGETDYEIWYLDTMRPEEAFARMFELASEAGQHRRREFEQDSRYAEKLGRHLSFIAGNFALTPEQRAEMILKALGLDYVLPWRPSTPAPPKKKNPYTAVNRPVVRKT